MSILIKGMKMPKNCNTCELVALVDISDGIAYGCRALKEMVYNDRERLPNCPLVPVPPHGDLIDINALKLAIVNVDYVNKHDYLKGVLNAINNAPIVIHADKDGEPC